MSASVTHLAQRQLSPRKMSEEELRNEYIQLMQMQHSLSMEDRRISAQIEALRTESVRFQQTAEVEDECVTNRLMRRLHGEEKDVSMCEDTLREEQQSVSEIAQRIRHVRKQRSEIEKCIDEQQSYQLHELQTKLVTAASQKKDLEKELQNERRRYLDVLQRLLQHMHQHKDAHSSELNGHASPDAVRGHGETASGVTRIAIGASFIHMPVATGDDDTNNSKNNASVIVNDMVPTNDNSASAAVPDHNISSSLVPSPCAPSLDADLDAHHKAIHSVQPGITADVSMGSLVRTRSRSDARSNKNVRHKSHDLVSGVPHGPVSPHGSKYVSDAPKEAGKRESSELSTRTASPDSLPLLMASMDEKVLLAEQRLNKVLQEQLRSVQHSIENEHRCVELANKLDYVQSEVFLKRAKAAKLKEELAEAQKQLEELGPNNLLDSILSDASFCTIPV